MKHVLPVPAGMLLWASLLLAACAVNPATGRNEFTPMMTPSQELSIGAQEHPKIIEQFGGVYDEPRIGGYVASIGGRVAANSELPDLRFHFTVLDSPIVNAFALPGGYVYVTRGLVALANNEAELASVLAHEVGHVTARHTAQRYNQTMGIALGGAVLGALLGNQVISDLINQGSQLYLLGYSRDQEYEADQLGIRYLTRTGYDPYAEADFLRAMEGNDALEAALSRNGGQRGPGEFFSTHPQTAKRTLEAIEAARATGLVIEARPRLRDEFLNVIEGMVYGGSPEHGFIRDRTFAHPKLRFSFTVPPGFRIIDRPEAVLAEGPEGIKIKFDLAPLARPMSMPAYLTSVWARDASLRNPEGVIINGMQAATAEVTVHGQSGSANVRLIAIGFSPTKVARIMILMPRQPSAQMLQEIQRFSYSFRGLSPAEAANLRPQRIRIVRVNTGDTVASLAERMPFSDYREARFRTLNGLGPGATLTPGSRVKLIAE